MVSRQAKTPKRIFHKIKEVCALTKTEPYVLRYWEKEFPFLAPEKNRAGQRIYTEDDIAMVLTIKRLLYEEGYTTAGARRRLAQEISGERKEVAGDAADAGPSTPEASGPESLRAAALRDGCTTREVVARVTDSLRSIREMLAGPAGDTAAEAPGSLSVSESDEQAPAESRPSRRPTRPRRGH